MNFDSVFKTFGENGAIAQPKKQWVETAEPVESMSH